MVVPVHHRARDRQFENRQVTLVEALSPAFFADAHLPGALNIPCDHVDELAPALLQDRSDRIVVYCSNPESTNSRIAARRLVALGYRNVSVYPGGKQDWIAALLPVEAG